MTPGQELSAIPRHDPGDPAEWRADLAHVDRLRQAVREREPRASDGAALLEHERRRALTASLFPDLSAAVFDGIARGSGAAAAGALAQRRARDGEEEGAVVLGEAGRPDRPLPPGEAGLAWPDWVRGFSLAAIARDREALAVLCTPATIDACAPSHGEIDAFWPVLCAGMAATAVEPAEAARLLERAEEALASASVAHPTLIAHCVRPTLALARALVGGDAAAFDLSLLEALRAHRAYFEHPERRRDWNGLLALDALALAALAHDRGMAVRAESGYLPPALVRGDFPRELSTVLLVFPPRSIASADEAHWVLDLEGFPRADRWHELVERGDLLVARYAAVGAPGIPRARAEFVLAGGPRPAGDLPPPALDAGELLYLAEAYASSAVPNEDPEARLAARRWLAEAVACVDAALARVAPGAREVPPETITSGIGRSLLEAEPGRFRRDRMGAYREALARHLERLDGPAAPAPAPPGGKEAAARAAAEVSIELIRAQVTPILEAIARDRSGEAVRMLEPLPEDYARVFVGEAVEAARRAYAAVWGDRLDIAHPSPLQTELRSFVAPAGMLSGENELSREFPGGYRAIARWLNPHRVWVRWRYAEPGRTSGLAYDGLVWCDDHWAWFPKPYRALRELSG